MRYTELVFSGGKKSGKTALAAMMCILTAVALAPIDRHGRALLSALLRKFLISKAVLLCRPDPQWII
jgi:hypothetical protein